MKGILDLENKHIFQETPFNKRQQNVLPRMMERLRDATNGSE